MDIKSVNSGQNLFKPQSKKDVEGKYGKAIQPGSDKVGLKSDKLELSPEAKKLQPIKQKISSGFYDKPDIIDQVARKIFDEIG